MERLYENMAINRRDKIDVYNDNSYEREEDPAKRMQDYRKQGGYQKKKTVINTRKIGAAYEQVAADYLLGQGYQILERNFRCKLGEIDLIAKDEEYLVFVEVKYRSRSDCGYPSDAVNDKKQKRISNAAAFYIWKKYGTEGIPIRFDVLALQGQTIQLYKNAFPFKGQFY